MRSISVDGDITIIGGGLAGTCAAIAAARRGAKVHLINNRPVLGGNSSSEIRVWVCGATAHGGQKFARETGIMGELMLENQYRNPEGNPYYWDQVLLDAVRAEPGITLWLNTDVREAEAEDGPEGQRTITSVTGWQMGSETLVRFESPMFIDASGDGLVGELVGADFRLGREAYSEYQEEWAPEVPDDVQLGSTILLYTKDVGRPEKFVPPSIAVKVAETPIVHHRNIRVDANGCDYWWIEYGGELDIVHDNERIRDELWGVVYGIWDHIKNSGEFDADNLTLEWAGAVPGKREYRRFLGDYVLTQNDIMEQRRYDDAIGFGGWSIDLHAAGGVYHPGAPAKNLFPAGVYHIPFGILYSRNVTNMMMAGRNVSATHVGFGTLRVMATCAVMGEAAGTGAALAVREGLSPRELRENHMGLLREALMEQDASVLGAVWDSPRDLALRAQATASSTLRDLSAEATATDAEPYTLNGDFGILLPVDPELNGVEVLVSARAAARVTVELWETGGGENHIPVDLVDSAELELEEGTDWVALPFAHRPETPRNVVVLFRKSPDVDLFLTSTPGPYGVLGLAEREPRVRRTDGLPQSNSWDAAPFRRRGVSMRVASATSAYDPAKVVGGYQRPYDGPQLWSSETMRAGRQEWIALDWTEPVEFSRLDVIFNDDVDEDIINLHHHRTPFDIVPELVRDYRVEAKVDGAWVELEQVEGNRHRRRVHAFENPVRADAIRLLIDATNGADRASVVAMRVFADAEQAE